MLINFMKANVLRSNKQFNGDNKIFKCVGNRLFDCLAIIMKTFDTYSITKH